MWKWWAICLLAVGSLGAQVVSSADVREELRVTFPRADIRLFDKTYQSLSAFTFLNDFVPFYAQHLQERGLRGISAGFSHKHYAELCKAQLQIWLIQKTGRSTETESAVLVADPQAQAAMPGLPSGWLLVRLDGQWSVFDAAGFRLTTLKDFPYKNEIVGVQF